ncbi:hypothetical protein QF026_001360 [Streptomyces aurantiacus]|uniref:hypothetical protein n=1 Tax=Streptomyces aurantiacus TaxID=47760 RepID=UPI002794727D|nr:hypothetical protein [Streptomyces aurantiacus]MDQ0772894.1 hypothetical protein [Streptomyces aurantiacus]
MRYHDIGKANPGFQQPDFLMTTNTTTIVVEAKASRAGATWRAQNVLETLSSELKGLRDHASGLAKELTLLLLRSAEEASSAPSITSGLIQGLEPTPPPVQLWHRYENRIEVVNGLVYSAMGGGKTFAALTVLLQRAGRVSRAEQGQTGSFLARLVNNTEVLREFLQALTQGLLCGGAQHIECLIAVPPHESSPCGVLRLAAPIVPGAPGVRSWPHQSTMTLAA